MIFLLCVSTCECGAGQAETVLQPKLVQYVQEMKSLVGCRFGAALGMIIRKKYDLATEIFLWISEVIYSVCRTLIQCLYCLIDLNI